MFPSHRRTHEYCCGEPNEETDTTKGTKKRLKCFKEPEQEVDDRTKEASCNVQNTPQLKEFRLTLFFHTLSV